MISIQRLRRDWDESILVDLGRVMHGESRYAHLRYAEQRAQNFAHAILSHENGIVLGAVDGPIAIGFVLGTCGDTTPFIDEKVANQQLLYLLPQYRKGRNAFHLINGFINEAKKRGAVDITFSSGTGYRPEGVARLFEVCGAKKIGSIHSMEV